ncbi:MAG: nuclear transport factor 2 family protein [Flavobacteriales bacterium]|nr:nuclear transport factor 2 family protein [Flavobacteriales bacterium]MCB9168534.1 nuclear transport factor 2 family protein [Flavobacteriales bacterium]
MTATKEKVMTTQEVAHRLVDLCRAGKNGEAVDELYAEQVVSREPEGARPPTRRNGFKEVKAAKDQWTAMVEQYHGQEYGDPIVAGDHFAVRMGMDVSVKGMGRSKLDEIAVFKVKDGKVVEEHFHYSPPPMN